MGPLATVDFYHKLVAKTPVLCDQDHMRLIIVADPSVPDRSQAILNGNTTDVFHALLSGVKRLESAGAEAIAIPCNSAHFWLAELQQQTPLRIFSIVESALAQAQSKAPEASTISVLGTEGTLRAGIYNTAIAQRGLSLIELTETEIEKTSQTIALVKSAALAEARAICGDLVDSVMNRSQVVLLACTELPIAAAHITASQPCLIDTTSALVDTCLTWSGLSQNNYETDGPDGSWH